MIAEDPIAHYTQGQEITLYVDFATEAGTPEDPDVVLLRIIEGDGTIVDVLMASLDNPSLGRWEFKIVIPKDGSKAIKPWVYRYEGSSGPGGITAAAEDRFEVDPSPFYP